MLLRRVVFLILALAFLTYGTLYFTTPQFSGFFSSSVDYVRLSWSELGDNVENIREVNEAGQNTTAQEGTHTKQETKEETRTEMGQEAQEEKEEQQDAEATVSKQPSGNETMSLEVQKTVETPQPQAETRVESNTNPKNHEDEQKKDEEGGLPRIEIDEQSAALEDRLDEEKNMEDANKEKQGNDEEQRIEEMSRIGNKSAEGQAEEPEPLKQANDTMESRTPIIHRSNDTTKAAVMIVPVSNPLISVVVLHFLKLLPKEWKVQIFHSPEMTEFLTAIQEFEPHVQEGRLSFSPTIKESMSYLEYGLLLRSVEFWKQVQGEHILVFQTDSILCANSTHRISDFLTWDYVGAPWRGDPQLLIGNGGLSLRRKSVMMQSIELCKPYGIEHDCCEDLWFALCFLKIRSVWGNDVLNLAPREEAMKFSVETVFYPRPLGMHKPWLWLDPPELRQLVQHCPDLATVAPQSYHYIWDPHHSHDLGPDH